MSEQASGLLYQLNLVNEDSILAAADCVKKISAEKLETVRFLFVDQHGVLRGKSLVADAAASAFKNGITAPSSLLLKDTSSRTVFDVWGQDAGFGEDVLTGAADMLLVPAPETFRQLPWSPHSAWVLCDVVQNNGSPIPFASRTLLSDCVEKLHSLNLELIVGLEIEFHVFKLDEEALTHNQGGMPGLPPKTLPLNQGYQLLGEVAYAAAEPLLDDLRRQSQLLGLPVRSTEVEFGPSQFEFTFDPAAVSVHAENMVLFRTLIKEVCARRNLHATFMCRPQLPNCAASGWHIHQSLVARDTGENLFMPRNDGQQGNDLTPQASGWLAGLLQHARASSILCAPTVNAYGRYKPGQLAPDRIQWSHDNKGSMLRAILKAQQPASRIENRAPEPAANPYYALASQILSGLDGLENKLTAPLPVSTPYNSDSLLLPESLNEANEMFATNEFYKSALGVTTCNYISGLKAAEWQRYISDKTDWEQREYFSLF